MRERDRFSNGRVEVGGALVPLGHFPQVEKVAHDALDLAGRLPHALPRVDDLDVRRDLWPHDAHVHDERLQWIVDLVGHARRELAGRRKPVGLEEPVLQDLALRDVPKHRDGPCRCGPPVPKESDMGDRRGEVSPRPPDLELEVLEVTLIEERRNRRVQGLPRAGTHEPGCDVSDDFLRVPAAESLDSRVDPRHASPRVEAHVYVPARLEHQAQVLRGLVTRTRCEREHMDPAFR